MSIRGAPRLSRNASSDQRHAAHARAFSRGMARVTERSGPDRHTRAPAPPAPKRPSSGLFPLAAVIRSASQERTRFGVPVEPGERGIHAGPGFFPARNHIDRHRWAKPAQPRRRAAARGWRMAWMPPGWRRESARRWPAAPTAAATAGADRAGTCSRRRSYRAAPRTSSSPPRPRQTRPPAGRHTKPLLVQFSRARISV